MNPAATRQKATTAARNLLAEGGPLASLLRIAFDLSRDSWEVVADARTDGVMEPWNLKLTHILRHKASVEDRDFELRYHYGRIKLICRGRFFKDEIQDKRGKFD